jgi:hypothetical protein
MLARARRSVLVVDAGAPRNAPATGVHGLLGHDGIRPAELLERGRAEVRGYGGQVVAGEVTTAARDAEGLTVTLADGRSVRGRRLLVTTGLADELPDIPGLRARWGRDVLHCPYCHGWEVRDQAIGVLATGPRAVHQAYPGRPDRPDRGARGVGRGQRHRPGRRGHPPGGRTGQSRLVRSRARSASCTTTSANPRQVSSPSP